ncbi:MAG TPA: hypothetical protein VFZ42_13950 [Chitinophagaceae bacterium]
MNNLPIYISLVFGLTTIISIYLFYRAAHKKKIVMYATLAWLVIQSAIALTGFYTEIKTLPPRFILSIAPPTLLIVLLFIIPRGRAFVDSLDKSMLTLLHAVRIPVEIVLLWLSIYKTVPQLMTFEGSNLDILSGISALVIYFLMFRIKKYNRTLLLVWNFICLGLLVNIVAIAILSAPFVFQRLAFDQPNIALMYFPFIWLPSIVVPLVLLSHLASIRQLIFEKKIIKERTFDFAELSR